PCRRGLTARSAGPGGTTAAGRRGRRCQTDGSVVHSAICSSTRAIASASLAPSARRAAYVAPACCASSSMMSASGVIGPNATRILACQCMGASSGVTDTRDAIQRDEELVPDAALPREHLTSLARDAVVAAPSLAALLDPSSFDQSAVLQPIERRVERRHVKIDGPFGPVGDQASDLVAMALPVLEQRQDEEFGTAALELAFECMCDHMWAQQI